MLVGAGLGVDVAVGQERLERGEEEQQQRRGRAARPRVRAAGHGVGRAPRPTLVRGLRRGRRLRSEALSVGRLSVRRGLGPSRSDASYRRGWRPDTQFTRGGSRRPEGPMRGGYARAIGPAKGGVVIVVSRPGAASQHLLSTPPRRASVSNHSSCQQRGAGYAWRTLVRRGGRVSLRLLRGAGGTRHAAA